jgi:cell division septum initiation protein DivIVA
VGGPELVDSLNEMVDQLIKENRQLKREVDKLSARGPALASGTVERTLRSIQRRLERAAGAAPTTRRRRTGAAAPTRRRRTSTAARRSG